MKKQILLVIFICITSCLFGADSIALYNNTRDHAFITNLVAQFPQAFPEAHLLTDLDSETIRIAWPDPAGGPAWVITYKQTIFVYCKEKKPIGFIRMFEALNPTKKDIDYACKTTGRKLNNRKDKISTVQQIAVAPEHHRKGIGEKLIHHVLHDAKQQGYTSIILNTMMDHSIACKFFEKVGFTKTLEVKGEESVWGNYCYYAINI